MRIKTKITAFLVILLFIFSHDLKAQRVIKVPRTDGSFIFGYFKQPETKNYPIALILQGSGKDSVRNTYERFVNYFSEFGIATISIEKRGIQPDQSFDEKEYYLHNYLDSRVGDYKTLVSFLHKSCNGWNKEIIVIGGSSGGDVAVKFSSQTPEAKLLVLISSGGGESNRNAMVDSFKLIIKKQGVSKTEAEEYINFLNTKFDEMISNPTTNKIFEKYSYRWWAETLSYIPIKDLIRFNNPIFMYHGTSDIYCPVKYADLVNDKFIQNGKHNLHYIRIEDCGHNVWECSKIDILQKITDWIQASSTYIKHTERVF